MGFETMEKRCASSKRKNTLSNVSRGMSKLSCTILTKNTRKRPSITSWIKHWLCRSTRSECERKTMHVRTSHTCITGWRLRLVKRDSGRLSRRIVSRRWLRTSSTWETRWAPVILIREVAVLQCPVVEPLDLEAHLQRRTGRSTNLVAWWTQRRPEWIGRYSRRLQESSVASNLPTN